MIDAVERRAMRDAVDRILRDRCREADVRRTMTTKSGHDEALWCALSEMGVLGLAIPVEHGGLGGGALEIEAVAEVAGAALLGGPFASSAVLAASLIAMSGDASAKARLLPAIAAGETIGTAALTGDAGSWTANGVEVAARVVDNGHRLDGVASYVTDAGIADVLIVVARTPGGLAGFEVAAGSAGLEIASQTCWDPTRRLSRIVFDDVAATPLAGLDERAVGRALDHARIWRAGAQVGVARRIFEITIDYLKTRVQFGRPIGGFQALKHMAADLMIEVESAASAARAAAGAIAADTPDREALVSLAAFACADIAVAVSAAAIQMHGGIAFTWEHPAHLYWRRASVDATFLGDAAGYRERYLTAREQAA